MPPGGEGLRRPGVRGAALRAREPAAARLQHAPDRAAALTTPITHTLAGARARDHRLHRAAGLDRRSHDGRRVRLVHHRDADAARAAEAPHRDQRAAAARPRRGRERVRADRHAGRGGQRHGRARARARRDRLRERGLHLPDAHRAGAARRSSLHVRPGETVALVGASGGGKTTLVNLLPRFYRPTAGRILLDGHDLETLTLESLRANIALVSARTWCSSTTRSRQHRLRRAWAGPPSAEVDRRGRGGARDGLHPRDAAGPGHADRRERLRLSGGQRQRLAIARALLKNAPVLILDEATSALDTESERQVQAALETLMRGRTTHRHRAPPVHHRARRPHRGARARPHRRDRHARRAARARRRLREAAPHCSSPPSSAAA